MTERLPSLWNLLNKRRLYVQDMERLVPVVHRYGITSLLLLDLIVILLYSTCNTAENERSVDRVLVALAINVNAR